MTETKVSAVAEYLDTELATASVADYPNALNGLQVENSGQVRRVAAAVDASERTIRVAIERGCDMLLVHHGLFWDGNQAVTGRRYRKLKLLLEHDVALYASHLPLDVHAELGNNALLARALGIAVEGTFAEYRGRAIGCWGSLSLKREVLAARLDDLLGCRIRMVAGGPEVTRRVGILTGSGGSAIGDAAAAGIDTLITGEGPHHTYFDALEGGLNVLFGGHYATETFGVRALAERVAGEFGLEWEFLELPTGT